MPDQNQQSNNASEELMFMDEVGEFQSLGKDDFEPEKPTISIIDTGKEELMLQPPPPAIRKATASFYFYPEDEEEVAKIKPPQDLPPQKHYSLDKILERVIVTFKLSLNPELKKRLRTVIYTFLRDRRTNIEAEDVLKRKKIDGGLEFELAQAEKILKFLMEIKTKILDAKGLVIDERVQAEERKSQALPSVIKEAKPLKTGLVEEKSTLPKISEPVAPIMAAAKKPQPLVKPKISTATPLKRPIKSSSARKRGKAAMDDIQKDYKLVGPVEELASLTLQTFRRLGADASSQTEKIINKVNLLSQQSLIKKAQGIQAWRRSPLYKMYLAIGQASMEHGLSVRKVIEQYITQGKEIMTLEEFEAISDLNKQFRF